MSKGYHTIYGINKLLDLMYGGNYTKPTTLYFGLSLIEGNKNGSVTEPSGGSYSRVAITNNSTNFPDSVNSQKKNGTQITFPSPTGNWGTILSAFISDASSGGNIIASFDLTTPRTINNGSQAPKFIINNFVISAS